VSVLDIPNSTDLLDVTSGSFRLPPELSGYLNPVAITFDMSDGYENFTQSYVVSIGSQLGIPAGVQSLSGRTAKFNFSA
jgi:hypothetical protein